MNLAPQTISTDVFLEKYAKAGETTIDQVYHRVAKGVAQAEKPKVRKQWEKTFYQNMKAGAIGAGRIMSAAGTGIQATLNNCYVQGIGDSIQGNSDEGYPGIYEALRESAETMRRGGGVGYDFSRIRPKDAFVKGTHSFASGPCSYMDVFDASCKTVESAGCFAAGTLIQTTKGLRDIKEIIESDEQFYAVTHLGPKAITAKFRNGVQPIWEITTKYGYKLRVTPEHKFAQFEEGKLVTKPLQDIVNSKNLSVLVLIPDMELAAPAWNNEEAEAYVLGAFHGNGCWARNDDRINVKGIRIANNTTKVAIVEKLERLMLQLGLSPKISKRPNENTLEISCYDTVFFRAWKDKGIDKGMDMSIPVHILKGNSSQHAAYVAGLMDADGCVSETKSNVRLRLITKPLMEDVQIVLASLGVPCTLKLERMAINAWHDIYCLGIYGPIAQMRYNKTVGKYSTQVLRQLATRDRVGYGHSANEVLKFGYSGQHFSKFWPGDLIKNPKISLNALVNTQCDPQFTQTLSDKIVSAVMLEAEETYDLEVADVHLLAGNGIYTSNSRRGAQLGALKITHPDIMEFITAKRTPGRWNNFNVSVYVTDAFMRAKNADELWELTHKAEPSQKLKDAGAYLRADGQWVYQRIMARDLWAAIMVSNYDFAEPGILFGDTINNDNNLHYVEVLDATNP